MQAEAQKMYSFSGKSDPLSEPWFSFFLSLYLKLFSCKEGSLGNCYGLDFICLRHCPSPPNTKYLYIESSFPVLQNVTAFGGWVFKEVCAC